VASGLFGRGKIFKKRVKTITNIENILNKASILLTEYMNFKSH